MILESDRLILRPLAESDAAAIMALDADPRVIRHTKAGLDGAAADPAAMLARALAHRRARPGFGFWAAEMRADGAFIGWFHLLAAAEGEAELGFRLRHAVWGRGYATEGARALIEHAFDTLGVARVSASALAANPASIRVMEKVGLRLAKRFVHPPDHPAVLYALERSTKERPRS